MTSFVNGFEFLLVFAVLSGVIDDRSVKGAGEARSPEDVSRSFRGVAGLLRELEALPAVELTEKRAVDAILQLEVARRSVDRGAFERQRRLKLEFLLRVLSVVNARIDRDSDSRAPSVPHFVLPDQFWSVPFVLGVDPNQQFHDHPELRLKYKELMREHEAKVKQYGSQRRLSVLRNTMATFWIPHAVHQYFDWSAEQDRHEVDKLIKDVIEDEGLSTLVFKSIDHVKSDR